MCRSPFYYKHTLILFYNETIFFLLISCVTEFPTTSFIYFFRVYSVIIFARARVVPPVFHELYGVLVCVPLFDVSINSDAGTYFLFNSVRRKNSGKTSKVSVTGKQRDVYTTLFLSDNLCLCLI